MIDFIRSEAFIQLIGMVTAIVLYLLRLKASEQEKKIIDMAVGIANGVEAAIPDDTDVAGLGKMDKALRRFKRDWKQLYNKEPKDVLVAMARSAIERWVHDRNSGRPL